MVVGIAGVALSLILASTAKTRRTKTGLVGPRCFHPRPPSACVLFGFDSGWPSSRGPQPRTGPDPDNRPSTSPWRPVGSHAAVTPATPAAPPRGGVRAPTSTRRKWCRSCRPGLGVAVKCVSDVGRRGALSTVLPTRPPRNPQTGRYGRQGRTGRDRDHRTDRQRA
jgi:hypothetical protein